jgi:pimeloyl-ACP methyl ester carboxylesterase
MHFEKNGSGPPVVLIHGLGAYSFSWRATVAALSGSFTTYAVDLLGFGKSPAPAAYTAEAQAEAVAAFIKAQGLSNPSIVGHSMGGSVCLYLAAQPAKAGALSIGKMVLIDAVAPELPAAMRTILAKVSAVPALPDLSPSALAKIKAKTILESAQIAPVTQEQIDGYAMGLSTPGQARALKEHAQTLSAVSFSKPALGAIKTKTRVIWGKDDPWLPLTQGNTLKAWLGNADLKEIANCGHIPHEEKPAETNKHIADFLK